MTTSTEAIADLYNCSLDVLASLRARGDAEGGGRERRAPRFPITRAAELVGRTGASIREAEREGPSIDWGVIDWGL